MAQDSDASRDSGRYKGDFRGGGVRLSALKVWRVRRGLSQVKLAQLVGVRHDYIQRIEKGRRGCNPWVAQKIAGVLGVDLGLLGDASALEIENTGTEDLRVRPGRTPDLPPRSLHGAYLTLLLEREVGSAYSALEENEFEGRCMMLSLEELLEVISSREREREWLKEVLAEGADLHPEVRAFFEEVVRVQPYDDIRVLAARRRQDHSEEEREKLMRAMRELLL